MSGNFFRFGIQSNGLLLTQDKVDFLNKYEVDFGFSYDAPYPFAVRDYVSDEICELVNKINRHSISPTCSNAYNFDPLLSQKCLETKFPKAFSIRNTINLSYSFNMPKHITDYNWNRVKESYRKLRIAAQLGDKFSIDWLFSYVEDMNTKYEMPAKTRVLSCMTDHPEIPITIDGRYTACQNGEFFFGTVEDSFDTIKKRALKYIKDKESPECETCLHSDICKIHCQLDLRNEDGSYVTCKNYYWNLYSIIKSELVNLTKPLSEEDKIWYKEQEELMQEQIKDFLNEGQRYARENTRLPKKLQRKGI